MLLPCALLPVDTRAIPQRGVHLYHWPS